MRYSPRPFCTKGADIDAFQVILIIIFVAFPPVGIITWPLFFLDEHIKKQSQISESKKPIQYLHRDLLNKTKNVYMCNRCYKIFEAPISMLKDVKCPNCDDK